MSFIDKYVADIVYECIIRLQKHLDIQMIQTLLGTLIFLNHLFGERRKIRKKKKEKHNNKMMKSQD